MKNKKLKNILSFVVPIYFLLTVSVFNLYGARYISSVYDNYMTKQILWILVGTIVMIAIYYLDIKFFIKYNKLLYVLGNIILLLLLFLGRVINGSKSWFRIGPLSFQPSELFKFLYLIFISYVATKGEDNDAFLLLKVLFLTFIPCVLIFLEPDTGVVLMYLLLMLGVILASKIKKRQLIAIILFFILIFSVFMYLYFFQDDLFIKVFGTSFFYRMDRLLSFTNNTSYQLRQALVGIGTSGMFGFGILHPKIYIPEVTTDFMFDLTILNFGYICGIVVVLVYTYILFRLYSSIKFCKSEFEKCTLTGIFFMFFFQIGEHILMNIGLTPITGITLPFMSYGGSSLVSYFMLFGLVLKITTNNSSYN